MGFLLHYKYESLLEAGCDEAGRGSLAGPVVAAAVILPRNFSNDLLDDSKKLSEKSRQKLRTIIEKEALSYGIGLVDEGEIDQINILNASIKAMHLALDQLNITPEMILVDGNRFKSYRQIPAECIIKGDGKYLSIAAASVLAKTYRDDFMCALHKDVPQYDWHKNKGYPTRQHRRFLEAFGASAYHRKSFTLLPPKQLDLF